MLFDTSQISDYDVFLKLLGAEEIFEFDGLANEHQYIDSMHWIHCTYDATVHWLYLEWILPM